MKNLPRNQKECISIVRKIIQEIDPDLICSSEEEEDVEAFDLNYICASISKGNDQEVYTKASIHRPINQRSQVLKPKHKEKTMTTGSKTVTLKKSKVLSRSVTKSPQETSDKLLAKASNGMTENPTLEKDGEAIFVLRFSNRSYIVDLTCSIPTCTCPRYKETNATCKHVVMTLVLLGLKNTEEEKKVLTAKKFNKNQRRRVDEKIQSFHESNTKTFTEKINDFQKSFLPKTCDTIEKLPDVQQTYGLKFKTYNEAMAYIKDPNDDNVAASWAVTEADSNRRKCPALHEGESGIPKGSLVLAADYNSVIKHIDGTFTTKRTRRHFHAKEACISSVPAEIKRFTNLKPVATCLVDASTLTQETREQIKRALPNINFS